MLRPALLQLIDVSHYSSTSDLFHPPGDRARFHPPPFPGFGAVQKFSFPGDLPIIKKVHFHEFRAVLRLLSLLPLSPRRVHCPSFEFCRTFSPRDRLMTLRLTHTCSAHSACEDACAEGEYASSIAQGAAKR
jgi:hypothetical protein